MKNPNFLVLDEPTNDLDIQTMQVLEEYLADFPGCVIIVSHDRYFMDKVVDHILVFKGQGNIKDFPGNYTQYREWTDDEEKQATETEEKKQEQRKEQESRVEKQKTKLSYKEKREFEQLEKDIEQLETEKKTIEDKLSSANISVDEITTLSKRLPIVMNELDEKTNRWLELSEYT